MICHHHKCIFIHVQRAGGTTIERWLQGEDQWNIRHNTKHITTGYARDRAYPEYFNDYFKFAFVRNPYEHVMSQLIIADFYQYRHFGPNTETPDESYLRFNYPEYINVHCIGGAVINDYHDEWNNLIPNSIYQNIFAAGIDKVYKFEEYDDAIDDIASILGIESPKEILLKHGARPGNYPQVDQLKQKDFEMINELYDLDFEKYGYQKRFV
jgi:hypothetical protein